MSISVLLIEDSMTQAEFYKDILEDIGLHVSIAYNGQTGLELAFNHQPHLIILDINLPIMDGIQVCSRLSRAEETRNIPVIMLTQRDRAEDALAGLKAGAVDYIAKDEFAVETLLASLEQLGIH